MTVKIYKELEQGSNEWFDIRRGKMTASHANTIRANGTGLVKYTKQKAGEIFSEEREPHFSNVHTARGNELEPVAIAHYELTTGKETYEVGFAELNKYIGVSPDRCVTGENGLVEVKCPARDGYQEAIKGKAIQPGYLDQMEMQMYVMGADWCDFVQFNPNFPVPLIIRRVYPDEVRRQALLNGLKEGVAMIEAELRELEDGSVLIKANNDKLRNGEK